MQKGSLHRALDEVDEEIMMAPASSPQEMQAFMMLQNRLCRVLANIETK